MSKINFEAIVEVHAHLGKINETIDNMKNVVSAFNAKAKELEAGHPDNERMTREERLQWQKDRALEAQAMMEKAEETKHHLRKQLKEISKLRKSL